LRLRSLHSGHAIGKINVTPLIDVVMVLIIFYLIVGKLATERRIELPKSGIGVTEAGTEPVTIDMAPTAAGVQLSVAGREISVDALEAVLKDLTRGRLRPVQIRAPKDMAYAKLEGVLAACRRAGLPSVRLVTEREG
jgi:biopolymer transport protein ExbD